MITKTPAKKGGTTKVTFELPGEYAGEQVCLCGEFNSWSPDATPMTKRKDGRFSATLTLPQGQSFRWLGRNWGCCCRTPASNLGGLERWERPASLR